MDTTLPSIIYFSTCDRLVESLLANKHDTSYALDSHRYYRAFGGVGRYDTKIEQHSPDVRSLGQ
jgi:hypothetical protein